MDMIDKQLAKDLAQFNAKPFDVEEIYKLGEDDRLKKEYKIKVLKLNEYFLLNNISVEEKKFEEYIYEWINSESKKDLSELKLSMIKAELLFFIGTFAFHEFLFKDESKNGITKIKRYESNLQKEEKKN